MGLLSSIGGMVTAGSSAKSIKNATAMMLQAINEAREAQKTAYGQNNEIWSPYTEVGEKSLGKFSDLLMGDPAKMQATLESLPGYQFSLKQGQNALMNQAGAMGLRQSGPAAKALLGYSQGLADQNYSNYAQQLAQLTGVGMQGASNQANNNTNYANQLQGLALQQGATSAQGALAKTAALNQGWGGLLNGLDTAMSAAMGGFGGGGGSSNIFGAGGMFGGGSPMSAGQASQLGITWA